MSSDGLIGYIEGNYDDLVEKFIEHHQELFQSFCMDEMINAGIDEDDVLDDEEKDLLE